MHLRMRDSRLGSLAVAAAVIVAAIAVRLHLDADIPGFSIPLPPWAAPAGIPSSALLGSLVGTDSGRRMKYYETVPFTASKSQYDITNVHWFFNMKNPDIPEHSVAPEVLFATDPSSELNGVVYVYDSLDDLGGIPDHFYLIGFWDLDPAVRAIHHNSSLQITVGGGTDHMVYAMFYDRRNPPQNLYVAGDRDGDGMNDLEEEFIIFVQPPIRPAGEDAGGAGAEENDRCGDGVVSSWLAEQCDDGNMENGDGCNAQCFVEQGYVCIGLPSVCLPDIDFDVEGYEESSSSTRFIHRHTEPYPDPIPVPSSSQAPTAIMRPAVIRFLLDPALVDTNIGDVGQRLSRYVGDMNKIYAKTTVRQFVFDPNVHMQIWDKPFPTGGMCYPLQSGYEYHVFVQKSPKNFSYNGSSLCNISNNNAMVSTGYKWEKIWSNSDIGTDKEARDDYYRRQLRAVIHEIGHSHGLGLGEYYSLATLNDDTGTEPDLDVRSTNPDDAYWSSRKKVLLDPMLSMPPLETFMEDMQFSPLSSSIINATANDSDLALCDSPNPLLCDAHNVRSGTQVPIKVTDGQTGSPISGCSLKIYKVDAGSPKFELLEGPEISANGTYIYTWLGASGSLHASTNMVRLVKASCPGYKPGGEWISVFDLQAAKVLPDGGEEGDFHFRGALTIELARGT